jgi:ABC-type antimicrobial peptide transport system permease subunit
MPGFAEIALGAAPIAGGALLGIAAGGIKGPDVRGMIAKDMELLERIPAEQTELRERLKRSIDQRIDDLVTTTERTRELRMAAMSYEGNWRDIVVFVCTVLFSIVWWNVSHDRTNWLVMFIVLVLLTVVAGIYAARGVLRALGSVKRNRKAGN